ncbi:MAG TPA: DNA-binding protein [Candidatus Thorarchaeota archaeon]|nr:MAG: DNA-binding protein [Candidatus Thorarchaeota archaeon]HDD67510.1 DNA-binding protein [Candidatus Thorarchaeota archaeon]
MPTTKTTQVKRVVLARMKPGEDIIETLERIATDNGIQGGQLNLIGAVSRATLGYFDRKRGEYRTFTIEKDLEVVSCMGNLSRLADGTAVVHAHMVASDETGRCYGGHVMRGCEVSATIEVIITEFDTELRRARDEMTGLNLLSLE